jgi:hypothetical protein
MAYDVFVEVSGWVKIGQVEADDEDRALVAADTLDRDELYSPLEVEAMVEVGRPPVFDICQSGDTEDDLDDPGVPASPAAADLALAIREAFDGTVSCLGWTP